jgi:hypothetical protein
MYKPTKQELKGLGFEYNSYFDDWGLHSMPDMLTYHESAETWQINYDVIVYPTRKEDIQTLIKLLTPKIERQWHENR